MVRTKRDKMSHSLPEWERLRELASEIKLYSNSHLDTLLEEFEKNAIANGAIVHWAKDAEEHNEIVLRILRQHDARNQEQIDADGGMPYERVLDVERNRCGGERFG